MAITLRNKTVEQQIRDIGRRTGEGPSAVIARLVRTEHGKTDQPNDDEAARAARLADMLAFLDSLPKPTEEERKAIQEAMDDMYDEFGLPK